MSKDKVLKIIELLELAYEKPTKFFRDYSYCGGFIVGLADGCSSEGFSDELYRLTHKQVAAELGWEYIANSPWSLILDTDWDEKTKMREVLKIEIETYKRLKDLL